MKDIINKTTILVVDDELDSLQFIVNTLTESNNEFIIYQANNAKQAINIARNRIPDAIITDWNMPEKSGIELIIELKSIKETKDIPVLVSTAYMLTPENLKTALESGAVDYIKKPINKIELFARVQSILKISSYNKLIIELKNKELAENTLTLIKNNEFNITLTKKIQDLISIMPESTILMDKINEITSQIDEKIRTDSWQKFQLVFETTHKNFISNILKEFPNLTNSEVKLSIFLKLGMSSKDIASVLYQTPESIKVSRSRLRKKLKLNKEQNLQMFLSSI